MDKNKRQREWEDALNLMTEEELQFIREHPVGYYQNFVKMATKKAWEIIDDPYPIPENEAVMNAILHILGEMGCQCEIDEDDEIFFCCQGAEFSIRFDEEFEYIKIVDNSWKKVNLNDSETVLKMTLAINRANIWNNVTIAYIIDKEEEMLDIFSSSSIPYFPNMTYLKKFVHNKLVEMLSSHDLVNRFLQEEKEFAINESFSQIQSHEAN